MDNHTSGPPIYGGDDTIRRAWLDHRDQQQFEHQLIDRKTTWLLSTQAILFAAYGVTFQNATFSASRCRIFSICSFLYRYRLECFDTRGSACGYQFQAPRLEGLRQVRRHCVRWRVTRQGQPMGRANMEHNCIAIPGCVVSGRDAACLGSTSRCVTLCLFAVVWTEHATVHPLGIDTVLRPPRRPPSARNSRRQMEEDLSAGGFGVRGSGACHEDIGLFRALAPRR